MLKDAAKSDGAYKLKKMRMIATGLLVLMTTVYFIFKHFESRGLLFSSVAAFAEAAMIGSLADWFAVVALFRHPLGMSWIPHTAIIQKNKERIGDSLSGFVISNFFTEDVIRNRLDGVDFSKQFLSYISANVAAVSKALARNLPSAAKLLANSEKNAYTDLRAIIKDKLKDVELYPLMGNILESVVSSGYHMPFIKGLLVSIHNAIRDNKEKTLEFIESIDKKLTLPFVGNMVYKSILSSLEKQIEGFGNDDDTKLNEVILQGLPKAIEDLKTSTQMIEKGEKLKVDILASEWFEYFLDRAVDGITDALVSYAGSNGDELGGEIEGMLNGLLKSLRSDDELCGRIDRWIKNCIVEVICMYRHEVGKLISDTVKEWRLEDMVDKLETQVGGDLQYIRINGTVIGGLAGLAIHLLSILL